METKTIEKIEKEEIQYRIYCIYSDSLNKCYIGSTTAPIHNRLLTHKAHFYQYKRRFLTNNPTDSTNEKTNYLLQNYSSFMILDQPDHKVGLLEILPVGSDKLYILSRERHFIANPPSGYECVNARTPGLLIDKTYRNTTTTCLGCGKDIKNYYKRKHERHYCGAFLKCDEII